MILSSLRGSALAVGATAILLAGCGDDGDAELQAPTDEGPSSGYVVATTGIWADIAGRVACDDTLEVRTIVPAGGDPHAYEPSLRDREVLDGAALVVANGLDLEESLADTLDAVEAGGVPVLHMSDHIATLGAEEDHVEEGDDHPEGGDEEHHHDGADPHVWFDPTRVSAALPALGDALVETGADRVAVDDCVAAAQTDLAALDEELTATLAAIPAERRVLVTNHDALGYFADRYDFEILGTVLPSTSTLTEASPGELEDLATEIDAARVPAIFTETFADRDDADALAASLGVDVVELYTDALGEPGSDADSYEALLRFDAAAVVAALGP